MMWNWLVKIGAKVAPTIGTFVLDSTVKWWQERQKEKAKQKEAEELAKEARKNKENVV